MAKCDYCGREAVLTTGRTIYPHRHDLHGLLFWWCGPCAAYVGCHKGTLKPLGRLANAELRQAKMDAHAAFDPLWKSGNMMRSTAYAKLADLLGIEKRDCHIGMMDVNQCRQVVRVLSERGEV